MLRHFALVLLATLTVAGCASTGGGSSSDRGNSDILTSQELREVETTMTDMYQAIRRLRPLWLRSRGSSMSGEQARPVVYVSGARYGELGTLRSIRTTSVQRATFMDASTATTRYGTGHTGGAILIRLHGGP